MARKKIKQEIKKPDIVMRTISFIAAFVSKNLKLCIAAGAACLVIVLLVYGYAAYKKGQEEKTQEALFQGIRVFETYMTNGKQEELSNAENMLQKVSSERRGNLSRLADLYLARINVIKGKNDEAKKLYTEIVNSSTSTFLKALSEKALQELGKK